MGAALVFLIVLLLSAGAIFPSITTFPAADGLSSHSFPPYRLTALPARLPTPDFSHSAFLIAVWSWVSGGGPSLTPTRPSIPTPVSVGSDRSVCESYTVQPGDFLGAIAERFGIGLAKLAELNNLTDINNINAGQVLIVSCPPGVSTPVAGTTPAGSLEIAPISSITPTVQLTVQLSDTIDAWTLDVYQFGSGPNRVALIGGIHGGYEWNTILLAYQAVDYFAAHPEEIPISVTLFLIPSANPTGQARVIGHTGRFSAGEVTGDTKPGRFNSRNVDLNRNWDCNWQPIGLWGVQEVSGGSKPFSEMESQLLRDFLIEPPMDAVVFWHSSLPGVIPGNCGQPLQDAIQLGELYSNASGYPLLDNFTSYQITGDVTDWLAAQGIPAITVELSNHQNIEWSANLNGIRSILQFVAANTP